MEQPSQAKTPQYCRDCTKRKRGDTWKEDYCRWKKKLCKDIRKNKQGGYAKVECNGYEGKQ